MFVSHHNISTDNWEEGNFAKTKKKKKGEVEEGNRGLFVHMKY
jgi:hypothetical protein